MKILITSDHAGFELKNEIVSYLIELGYDVNDKGPSQYYSEDDYPDLIAPVADVVSKNSRLKAIIIGGSGQGEAIVANRFKGVRAVVYNTANLNIIKLSREHNDANVLSLGARFLSLEESKEAVRLWLKTEFSNDERHLRRLQKIELLSDKK
ncbi:MAG: RpiB/LacA/LacB family sugar-phosphate isomerase [Patescibacteria group bacterium]|nr:RpiB/LacA/LacB family sugar-phosphate isomerase [Patescibacteria group bacterium]